MNTGLLFTKVFSFLALVGAICLLAVDSRAQTSYVMPAGGGNASDSGSKASKKQDMTAVLNIAAGAMYGGICASSCPKGGGCWACPMVPMALSAASSLKSASGKSSAAGRDMAAYDPSLGYGPEGVGDQWKIDPLTGQQIPIGAGAGGGSAGGSMEIAKGIQDLQNQLSKVGVKISPDGKTVTTPDGRTFNIGNSDGSGSKADLMAMGLTASEADAAMATASKFAKDNASKFAQMKQLDGGAGGGAGARSPASADGAGGAGGYSSAWDRDLRNPKVRNKISVSGLTKKFGDDTIGVSGDNIFEMVTRRYKARDQKNDFLKD